MPHTQSGVLRDVRAVPKQHSSRQQNEKKKERWLVSLGFSSVVSQAHSNRSIALLLIVKGAGGGSGMLHHTKVNDCVTEAGCNKQSGMTHFPEGWTRLGRRRRWLASPSGLARERAREKKKKGGTVHPRISCGRPLSQWWREGYTGAKRKKIPGWARPAGLAGWGWARTGTCQTGPPTLGVHTTLPRSIGPKPGPVKPLKLGNKLLNLGLCAPSLLSQLGPAQGANTGNALEIKEPSVPRGGKGMAGAFQVWLAGSTHLWLTHPLVMLAGRHDETLLSLPLSFVPIHPRR